MGQLNENTHELLAAPHPYMKINRKKSEFWGYQTWVPDLLPCEISKKNNKKRIHGDRNTVRTKKSSKQCFSTRGKFLSFLPRIRFMVFFHKISHGGRLRT